MLELFEIFNACVISAICYCKFVTDWDLALMNAAKKIFLTSHHFLYRWHIRRNIVGQCKKSFAKKKKFNMFMYGWKFLVMAASEDDFGRLFN